LLISSFVPDQLPFLLINLKLYTTTHTTLDILLLLYNNASPSFIFLSFINLTHLDYSHSNFDCILESPYTKRQIRSGSLIPFNGPDLFHPQTIAHMYFSRTAPIGAISTRPTSNQDHFGRIHQWQEAQQWFTRSRMRRNLVSELEGGFQT
jgi:hypothetical protein